MDYEKNEKKFIIAYEKTIADEGREICKEIENSNLFNNELFIDKVYMYCDFISKQDDVDPKLIEKCRKYMYNVNNFYRYKSTFDTVCNDRKEKEKYLKSIVI